MDKVDTLRKIKIDFRRGMNGIVSAAMRERGVCYKVNFGLTLPLIKAISKKYPQDTTLADMLWEEDIRESKMLAPMLHPASYMTHEKACKWIEEIKYNEISDICNMTLFCKLPFAAELAIECAESKSEIKKHLGITLFKRLIKEQDPNKEQKSKIKDIAINYISGKNSTIALDATELLEIINTI